LSILEELIEFAVELGGTDWLRQISVKSRNQELVHIDLVTERIKKGPAKMFDVSDEALKKLSDVRVPGCAIG
jgi:hypothetical protein